MLAKRRKKDRGSTERLAFIGAKNVIAVISTKMLAHASHFRDIFPEKTSIVHYDRKKCGTVNQSPRAVRKRTFAKRQIDRYDSRNKRLKGWSFLRGGGDRNLPPLRSSLCLLSDESESKVKRI